MTCNCTQTGFSDSQRDHHGIYLHAPYCEVGSTERKEGRVLVPPFGTRPPYTDGILTATPLPPNAVSFQERNPASRREYPNLDAVHGFTDEQNQEKEGA